MNKDAFTRDVDSGRHCCGLNRHLQRPQDEPGRADAAKHAVLGLLGRGAERRRVCVRCPPDFVPGKLHFKNNFCDDCRDGIMVPVAHVRALSAEQAACFTNKFSKGFWNVAPAALGGGQYRIINNTAGCIGPWLAVFQSNPPHLAWSAHAREH